jgi:HK97 family phage prohead protease
MKPELIIRSFEAQLHETSEERIVEGRIVPYNVPARVSDPGGPGAYDEEFLPGAFSTFLRGADAGRKVLLDFEHYGAINDLMLSGRSMSGTIGHSEELDERDDGLYGRFRVLNGPDGDKALELVKAKVLTGFSAAFQPLRSLRSAKGVVQRARAHLDGVALCRVGSWPGAEVLAVRTPIIEPEQAPLDFDPELALRLQKYELEIPAALLNQVEDENDEDEQPAAA